MKLCSFCKELWKQSSICVLRKRGSENMQQIYSPVNLLHIWEPIFLRTSIPKSDFNKPVLQVYWNHTSAWVFSSKFAAYLQSENKSDLHKFLFFYQSFLLFLPYYSHIIFLFSIFIMVQLLRIQTPNPWGLTSKVKVGAKIDKGFHPSVVSRISCEFCKISKNTFSYRTPLWWLLLSITGDLWL